MFEYVGNLHVHSTSSDGSLSIEEIAVAAKEAGIDFVGINDHHHLRGLQGGKEGWYCDDTVLILVGTEVNYTRNHYLAYNVTTPIPAYDTDPQKVIDACKQQGGIGFIAHPFEKGCPLKGDAYPWTDQSVTDYTGIEIWNFCSMWKEKVWSIPHGLYYYWHPVAAVREACPEARAWWDRECQYRKVVAIGGSDAHGYRYRKGLFSCVIFPYPFLFQTINVHILTPTPFRQNLPHDKQLVYTALQQGHLFLAYERLASARGFSFTAYHPDQPDQVSCMGDEISWRDGLLMQITLPSAGEIWLLKDGKVYQVGYGKEMEIPLIHRGVYRVEVYLYSWLRTRRGWIYSNPIYVR